MMRIACDIHAHVWDAEAHMSAAFRAEAHAVSGRPDAMAADLGRFDEIFGSVDRVVVCGGRALRAGLAVPNDFVLRFAEARAPRCCAFLSVDPCEEGFMDEFDRCLKAGFLGVKLLPTYAGFDPRDARLDPLYAACERRRLPVLFHMGTTFIRRAPLRFAQPALLEETAEKFPELRMVIAHFGHPWEHETAVLIRKQPNIFTDLSALYYRPWQLFNSLMLMQEYGVMRKVLFGTDWPFTTPADTVDGLRRIARFGEGTNFPRLDPAPIEEIFSRDSLRLLGIDPMAFNPRT
jgi:uncharacterized protein